MAELDAFKLKQGDSPPDFELPGIDGLNHKLSEYTTGKLLLVIFSCNHCPYAQAWEGRIIEIAREYSVRGVETVMINPNETVNYPDDTMEKMIERAKERAFPFAYLRDDSQDVAHAYGALVTPHIFLFESVAVPKHATFGAVPEEPLTMKLVYQGKVDDSWKEPAKAGHHYLKDAIESVLGGKPVSTPTTSVIGCTVKWKSETAVVRAVGARS